MPDQTLRDGAVKLVNYHRRVEPALKEVAFYPDPDGKEIRLLEVVNGSFNSDEVFPFRFPPDPERGVHFPVVIVELSPREYVRLKRGELTLPEDWRVSQPEVIWSKARPAHQ